jgi:hypothetical protein
MTIDYRCDLAAGIQACKQTLLPERILDVDEKLEELPLVGEKMFWETILQTQIHTNFKGKGSNRGLICRRRTASIASGVG